jgi:hypothetical protein
MSLSRTCLAAAALLALLSQPAGAASSASSASSAGSASVGSLSDSIQGSSNSSSKATQVAQGEYRIVEIAAAGDAAGRLKVTLQATAPQAGAAETFALLLPAAAAEAGQLAAGGTVQALERPYGLEFRSAATAQAFFLVVADEWQQGLQTRPV